MLKYFSIAAMLAVLIVFSTLGLADNNNKIIEKVENKPEPETVFINANFEHLTPKVQRQVLCLANNIYFEARSEPIKGQIAVAFVTLNRVSSELFPDSICDVVKQKRNNVCQFSWYCESRPKRQYTKHILTGEGSLQYNEIIDIATFVYANYEKLNDPTHGSLFYHADYVSPGWRKRMDKVAVIGAHIFYRLRDDT
jgi:spore germination cell wall hydrolase CwlJ-like protein